MFRMGAEQSLFFGIKITLPITAPMVFMLEVAPPDVTTTAPGVDIPSRQFTITSVRSGKHPDAPALSIHTSILRSICARSNAGNLRLLLVSLIRIPRVKGGWN